MMTEEPQRHAERLIETLRNDGQPHHASRLADVLSRNLAGRALLEALRDASDTVLAGIEALDPAAVMALEDFRRSVDQSLTARSGGGSAPTD